MNEEDLRQEIQRLKDELDLKEAERLDACDSRNIAYIELEEAQAENQKLREMAKAIVKWEQVALEIGEDDLDSFSAFQMGLMLSLAIRLAKEVLGEGEVELDILKRVEELFNEREAESRMLDWLEVEIQKCFGSCPWYRVLGDVHLHRKPLREALREAMTETEEVTGSRSSQKD
jgi:hypothetical protein